MKCEWGNSLHLKNLPFPPLKVTSAICDRIANVLKNNPNPNELHSYGNRLHIIALQNVHHFLQVRPFLQNASSGV